MTEEHRYPSTFRITRRAAEYITSEQERITEYITSEKEKAGETSDVDYVPEITVSFGDKRVKVQLGFWERARVPEEHMQIVDGLELVENLHESMVRHFVDRQRPNCRVVNCRSRLMIGP
jgi:hypothetical protein